MSGNVQQSCDFVPEIVRLTCRFLQTDNSMRFHLLLTANCSGEDPVHSKTTNEKPCCCVAFQKPWRDQRYALQSADDSLSELYSPVALKTSGGIACVAFGPQHPHMLTQHFDNPLQIRTGVPHAVPSSRPMSTRAAIETSPKLLCATATCTPWAYWFTAKFSHVPNIHLKFFRIDSSIHRLFLSPLERYIKTSLAGGRERGKSNASHCCRNTNLTKLSHVQDIPNGIVFGLPRHSDDRATQLIFPTGQTSASDIADVLIWASIGFRRAAPGDRRRAHCDIRVLLALRYFKRHLMSRSACKMKHRNP